MAKAFAVVALAALMSAGFFASNEAQTLAGSMRWFELEDNGICRPSPVNRLARPQVCLGFEMSAERIASR
jgi:hypothetical protein